MWAYRLMAPSSLEAVQVDDLHESSIADGQVLLRTLAGGICGSDLPYYRGEAPLVDIPGVGPGRVPHGYPLHEVVGEVVASRDPAHAVGSVVVGWAAGMAGLAEYVPAVGSMLVPVPEGLPPSTAVLLQPLACVIEAVDRLGDVAGRSAVVLGLGPIGLLFAHVLDARGAGPVIGVDRVDRTSCAQDFGLSRVFHGSASAWADRLPPVEERAELVVEAIGHQVGTLAVAVETAAPDGVVLYFGIPDDPVYPLPMSTFVRKNLRLLAGTTRHRADALRSAVGHLAAHPGLAESYVTHVYPRSRVDEAFRAACRPAPGQLKVVLDLA
jgi:threonine dehydrogenase-like Zn-dependent dehydrogenase